METPTSGLNRACVLSYGESGGEAFVSIAYRSCELGWVCLDIEKGPLSLLVVDVRGNLGRASGLAGCGNVSTTH